MPIFAGDWAPGTRSVKLPDFSTTIILNLEGPFFPGKIPATVSAAAKAGPSLHQGFLPPVNQPTIFSLANNHIMDYGAGGLQLTELELHRRQFSSAGAGQDLTEARRPLLVRTERQQTIGLLSCCEAQFGVATLEQPGVAEVGPWIYEAIGRTAQEADAVVVSIHGGVEDSPWPTPHQVSLYRSYIDAGANIVHGHHAHMPQGFESYGDGVIFYGMGNFVVDPFAWENYENATWSLAALVDFGHPLQWTPVTFTQRWTGAEIALERDSPEQQWLREDYFAQCNAPLREPRLLLSISQEVAIRCYIHYGAAFLGLHNPFVKDDELRRIQRFVHLLRQRSAPRKQSIDIDRLLLQYHIFACESHRQVVRTALGVLSGELDDQRAAEVSDLVDKMMPWSIDAGRAAPRR